MLIIHTVPEAIGLMLVGAFLLGTWPAVWNLIEQRGRTPSHIFLDYALTYLVVGTIVALTLGQLGPDQPQFIDQLYQQNGTLVAFALAGGFCLALGDLGMQYATALLGLSIGPPVLNALTVIIGVILAYFLDGGINKPQLVFPGMACAAFAIILGAAAHLIGQKQKESTANKEPANTGSSSSGASDNPQAQLANCTACSCSRIVQCKDVVAHKSAEGADAAPVIVDMRQPIPHSTIVGGGTASNAINVDAGHWRRGGLCLQHDDVIAQNNMQPRQQHTLHESQNNDILSAASGAAVALHMCTVSSSSSSAELRHRQKKDTNATAAATAQLQSQRSIQLGSNSKYLGLAIAVVGGIIYGLFLPAFQVSATDPFNLAPPGTPPLSVYTANFYFSAGFAVTSVVINMLFLYRPPLGTQASSIKQYVCDNKGRGLSIVSGMLAAFGDLTQFIGGQTAGYAACMLVMAYPVVGVLWGMGKFKEFKQGSKLSLVLIAGQVLCYAAAVGLLAASAELRSHS